MKRLQSLVTEHWAAASAVIYAIDCAQFIGYLFPCCRTH